jgi:hypothetical protein
VYGKKHLLLGGIDTEYIEACVKDRDSYAVARVQIYALAPKIQDIGAFAVN